jgi:hypothetical protein
MANIGKWNTPTSIFGILSTELNSLAASTATTGMSAASPTYTNSTNLNIYCDLELNLAALSPSAGAYCGIYIWEEADAANFPAQSAADLRLCSTQLLCTIPIGVTASTAQRVIVRNLVLPPADFKLLLDNQTGAALASSGNTVKLLAYNINGNG